MEKLSVIHVREYIRNQEWTIQRNWQHWVQKEEDKQTTKQKTEN